MHAVLIWDGAGFHTGEDVVVPSNVSLIQLPPYSPELNPVENLWHYFQMHITGRTAGTGITTRCRRGGQESVCGPRRHRNDQDRLQFSIYLKGRMKLPESVLLDDALDFLSDEMALTERISYRLAVQFCFSCLLEADKALLINDDEPQYIGAWPSNRAHGCRGSSSDWRELPGTGAATQESFGGDYRGSSYV